MRKDLFPADFENFIGVFCAYNFILLAYSIKKCDELELLSQILAFLMRIGLKRQARSYCKVCMSLYV